MGNSTMLKNGEGGGGVLSVKKVYLFLNTIMAIRTITIYTQLWVRERAKNIYYRKIVKVNFHVIKLFVLNLDTSIKAKVSISFIFLKSNINKKQYLSYSIEM